MLVGHDFRNWRIYQYKSPRWVGPHKSTLAFMGQQALVPAEVWKSGGADPEFPLPCSKIVQDGNRRFGTQHDHCSTHVTVEPASGAGFKNSAEGV